MSDSWVNKRRFQHSQLLQYVEEENLSRIIRGLQVDFIITDDVQKPLCSFYPKVLGSSSVKPSIVLARFTPSHTHVHHNHMSLQTDCVQFRVVGTLPKSGFVSEGTLRLEASCRAAFAIAKENAYNWGVTYQTIHYGYNRKEDKRRNSRKLIHQNIQHVVVYVLCHVIFYITYQMKFDVIRASVTLQLDESTDVSNCTHLLVYCWYMQGRI